MYFRGEMLTVMTYVQLVKMYLRILVLPKVTKAQFMKMFFNSDVCQGDKVYSIKMDFRNRLMPMYCLPSLTMQMVRSKIAHLLRVASMQRLA